MYLVEKRPTVQFLQYFQFACSFDASNDVVSRFEIIMVLMQIYAFTGSSHLCKKFPFDKSIFGLSLSLLVLASRRSILWHSQLQARSNFNCKWRIFWPFRIWNLAKHKQQSYVSYVIAKRLWKTMDITEIISIFVFLID